MSEPAFINYEDAIDGTGILNSGKRISGFFKREQVSASLLKAWLQCPARALAEQVFPSESEALTVGSKTHEILEKYYSEQLSKEETLDLCSAKNLDLPSATATKVKKYVEAFFKIPPYNDAKAEYLTEQKIITEASPLNVSLPVKLLGFIDRIDLTDEGTYLIDYKTGSRAPSEGMYLDQMIFYKWIYEAYFGQPVSAVYVASLFVDNPKYIEQHITLRKESELVDKIFLVDEQLKAALNNGNKFMKNPGWYCKWCPIKEKCEKSKKGSKVKISGNPFL